MKVLAIIHAPVFSGPHNTMTVLGRVMREHGVDITVLLPVDGEAAAERIRSQGVACLTIPLHRARTVPDPRVQWRWLRTLGPEVREIVRLVDVHKFDLIVTHTLPNVHGARAARKAGIPLTWEIIDTYPPAWFVRLWMPFVLRSSDSILTTGRKVAEAHPGTTSLGERWVSYFPAVDVERFRADPDVKTRARRELGLPDDATVIGNVAAISPMKGHIWFIRAAALVRKSHPKVRFVILGSTFEDKDDYYASLWAEAERLGLKVGEDLVVVDPQQRVSELAQAFDLFWMTSEPRSEGIPTVIGEAKALGLPVVATDVGSTSEGVTDGVSGYVVPPRDPQAIVDATIRIIDNTGRRESMGREGRREAEQQFAAERCGEKHLVAFERAIEHHAVARARGRRLLGRRR